MIVKLTSDPSRSTIPKIVSSHFVYSFHLFVFSLRCIVLSRFFANARNGLLCEVTFACEGG